MMNRILLLQKHILFLFILLVSASSFAGIKITSISGVSASEIGSDTAVAYGGIVGAPCASSSTTSTCNNCTTNDEACNRKRVHDNLIMRVNFKVDGDTSGDVHFGFSYGGSDTSDLDSATTPTSISANGSGTVTVSWDELCDIINATGCVDPGALPSSDDEITLYISVGAEAYASGNTESFKVKIPRPESSLGDPDDINEISCDDASPSAGVCRFRVYPGDEKVYIDDVLLADGTCDTTFVTARFYVSSTSFADASYDTTETFADLSFGEDCSADGDWQITGLQNDIPYYFRASVVDKAGNNFFLTSDTAEIDTVDNCAADDPNNCRYIAVPGNVVGLLSEDLNCFISTAAFGSSFAPQVKIFRQFRNQFLITSDLGREIIKFYYDYGPKGARFISDKPALRALTRVLLAPPLTLAWLSIHYGLGGAFLIIFMSLAYSIFFIRSFRRGMI